MGRTSRAAGAAVAVVSTAVVVHAAWYDDAPISNTAYLGVLVCAAVGAWIGAERAPRDARRVPRLIAVGLTLSALGDITWTALDLSGAGTDVSVADPFWFSSYAFLCAALWVVLLRNRPGSRVDVDFVIDALTIVVVSMLVFWNTSIDGIVGDQSAAPLVRAVWASYPVMDAVLLALVVRVLISRSARATIGTPFAAGVCLWLAADVAYLETPTSTAALVLMDTGWMVAPALLASAAWRRHEAAPETSDQQVLGGRMTQLVVAVGALAVPAGLELANDLRGEPNQLGLLLTGTAALIGLAFVRTARLLSSEARTRHELEEARDAALEASRAKSMFLANMSHEIRTPLTTVLAVGEILEDTSLDPVQRELLGRMHRSGEVLKGLVERTLDFSRIEAGQIELASSAFDLHAMVADVAEVYVPRAAQNDLRFECDLGADVPRLLVGDQLRLFEILTNLLDNALKFTEHGTVGLAVRPVRGDGADHVEFVVADTGIGIPAENQEAVFESFTQVDGSTTRRYNGSGLGLAICKELTELMGGSISLSSQPGSGSRFVIRLPAVEPRDGVPPGAAELPTGVDRGVSASA